MKNFILKFHYYSTDWHDWRERGNYLTYDGSDNIPEEKIVGLILQDFTANHFPKFQLSEKELRNLGSDDCFETKVNKECSVGVTRILSENEDFFLFDVDCCGVNNKISYEIVRIADDDVVYLPIREYICAPKYEPLVERCFTPFFRTLEEAEAAEAVLPNPGARPFHETDTYILRTTERKLVDNEWYQDCLLAMEKDPEFKYWSPDIVLHLKQIDADIA